MRITGKLVVAAVAAVAIGLSASDANAFGRHHRGGSSGGSSGSWGSSGGSSGSWGSSGGSYGSWGSSGSWGGSNGSWGGSSGGSSGGGYYRSNYGSSGSWGSSGGSSGGYYNGGSSGGSSGGGVIYDSTPGTPAAPAAPADGAAPAEPAPADAKSASTGTGLLMVRVPADAKIFVNGQATNSAGSDRQYISRGLVRGASYNFEVKAEMVRNGEPLTITKFAKLTAGGTAEMTFDTTAETQNVADAPEANGSTRTTLKVLVPAEAKVFLAGNETKQTGDVREFTTTKLAAGDNWADYTVRAQAEVNGQLVTKEQVVSIKAGDTKEISFDFAGGNDDSAIAETASK